MRSKEIKSEIQKAMDNVPESVLREILNYLKELQSNPKDQVELSHHLRKILEEDRDLLKKLAK